MNPAAQILTFKTEAEWLAARASDVTTTDVAALFGLSPYCTPFELFHRKRDASLVEFQETERMKWGKRLQRVIAEGICEDRGWRIEVDGDLSYAKHPTVAGMGASFDYLVSAPDRPGLGLLEIKNVDFLQFRDGWIDAGEESEAPPHIELQLQAQAEVLGVEWGCAGALVGGNRVATVDRERDPEVGATIVAKVNELWERIALNTPPRPDFTADAGFISRLYGFAEPGKVMEHDKLPAGVRAILESTVAEYQQAASESKSAEDRKDAARAKLLTVIGAHERVTHPEFTITAAMVAPTAVAYERAGYRGFRITKKKGKSK